MSEESLPRSDEEILAARRLDLIAKVGEQTVFPEDRVLIGEWSALPATWNVTPHIVRGPEYFCGPSLIAIRLDQPEGPVYFPVPELIANLLGAAYEKGRKVTQAEIRKALGLR
jgi:hypothetical protein